MKKWIFILPLFMLAVVSCNDRSKQAAVQEQDIETANVTEYAVVTDSVLLDTTGEIKGYETDKYTISVDSPGTYNVAASSENSGLIFVIQDEEGNNIANETASWSGELKNGNYTFIVGLTRNAARNNKENEVAYSIQVERE